MFVRIVRQDGLKEMLINVESIWKIEIEYGIPKGNTLVKTSIKDGTENPQAVRMYKVFVRDEVIVLAGNPDDPAAKVLEDIYKRAVKG